MPRLSRDDAKTRIREAGLRATAPRVAVLRLLTRSDHPLSHADVVDAIGGGDWDQATLYRNLLKLKETGLARVASQVGGITRYEVMLDDADPHVHPHFACKDCGMVACLPEARLVMPGVSKWQEILADADLQVVGSCDRCRDRGSAAKRRGPATSSVRRSKSRRA